MENRDEIIREQNGENMDTAENAELQQEARGQVNALKSKFREEMVLKIQKAFSPERRKKTVISFAGAIAVIVLAAVLLVRGSASSVAKRYCAAFAGDIHTQEKLTAYDWRNETIQSYKDEDDFFEAMSDQYGEDVKSWGSYYRAVNKDAKESVEDYVGKYSKTVSVTKVRDISVKKLQDDMQSFINRLEKNGSIDADKISAAKSITVKMKIKGEEQTIRNTYDMYLVKIGMAWEVLDYDVDFDYGD